MSGKLPGERELAKRFSANAKTMGKALTDLAAEGLLDRRIGRGTYVRGSERGGAAAAGKWLILCDREDGDCPVIAHLVGAHADAEVVSGVAPVRPSFLNQFSAVIDLATSTPEELHRDLLVRGIPVLLLEKESVGCRMSCIVLDRVHAVAVLTREMILGGHRRILVVEGGGEGTASRVARMTALRYAPEAVVESCRMEDIGGVAERSTGAIFCARPLHGRRIEELMAEHSELGSVSIAATGVCADEPPHTGIYITPGELAAGAIQLLGEASHHRPTSLWLSGRYIDRGTIRVVGEGEGQGGKASESRAMSA